MRVVVRGRPRSGTAVYRWIGRTVPTAESLKGYLLEEVLAYLIRNAGYRLLVHPSQDPRELRARANGLVVVGRGGMHQADALGQLLWIPAFTFPIRLFVEAKFRRQRTQIRDVRNAIGVVEDLNQNYSASMGSGGPTLQRFTYRYALFSTSGFSTEASDLALAHQISLIDLSGPDFAALRSLVEQLAALAMDRDDWTSHDVRDLRGYIRRRLGTWPQGVPLPDRLDFIERQFDIAQFDDVLVSGVRELQELFVAMAKGPFLLILRPDQPERFLQRLQQRRTDQVIIRWRRSPGQRPQWTIRPVDEPQAYSLAFGLPPRLEEWIFGDEELAAARALNVKDVALSDITIYRHVNGRDELYRLVYDAEAMREVLASRRRRGR
jgi:hypothetical protein